LVHVFADDGDFDQDLVVLDVLGDGEAARDVAEFERGARDAGEALDVVQLEFGPEEDLVLLLQEGLFVESLSLVVVALEISG